MQEKRAAQQDPLNLRSLPAVAPEDDGWAEIEARLLARNQRQARLRRSGASLALAATVVLAVTLWIGHSPSAPPGPEQPAHSQVEVAEHQGTQTSLATLMSLSRQLEERLQHYRSEHGDLPSGLLVYQVELQDLVAQVDEEISVYPQSLELWNQRVRLLMDISRLYENRLRREYHQLASL